MLLVFVVFFVIIQNNIREAQEEKNKDALDELKGVITKELNLAEFANDGYSRVFMLPLAINGVPYQLNFSPNEVRITFGDIEKPFFFVPNVTNYSISPGFNRVAKFDGKITIMNESSICGDGVLESPNFEYVFEDCDAPNQASADTQCANNPKWNNISWTRCNLATCFCEYP